jgi:hypothetical protein
LGNDKAEAKRDPHEACVEGRTYRNRAGKGERAWNPGDFTKRDIPIRRATEDDEDAHAQGHTQNSDNEKDD